MLRLKIEEMILNIVMPIPMPINTGGVAPEDMPKLVVMLIVAWLLCIILGAILSFFAIRKYNQNIVESNYNQKIRYREIFNPQVDIKHLSLDNMLGTALLSAGYVGLCMMVFVAIVLWITNLIIG